MAEQAKLPTELERIALDRLIPYARNSRTHSETQVAQIAASIREFGFTNPVLIGDDDTIIAGHGRVLAARQLGLDVVPCLRLSHLTDAQRRAYVIADNKLALNAGWDNELLALELGDLNGDGFDIRLTGFDDREIELMLGLADDDGDGDDERDLSGEAERFEVVVECDDEAAQERAYNFLTERGYKCRISTF